MPDNTFLGSITIDILGTKGYEHRTRGLSLQEAPCQSALCLVVRNLVRTWLCCLLEHAQLIYPSALHTEPVPYITAVRINL